MSWQVRTERKSSPNYDLDPRARVIDELQRISKDYQNDFLGDDWAENAKKYYACEGILGKVPSFRPQVQIPQFQTLAIGEAAELSDLSPKVYIYDKTSGDVDEERSKAFQQEFLELWIPHHTMFSSLWAQFTGIGYLQLGYDPFSDLGFGKIWCRHRDPGTVDWDYSATCREDATYLITEDRMYPDKVAYYFPETGRDIPVEAHNPGIKTSNSPASAGTLPPKIRFPEGPMRYYDAPVEGEGVEADGKLSVRYLFIDDRTVEMVKEEAGGDSAKIVSIAQETGKRGERTRRLKYPNKRLIVCVRGRTSRCVADGNNPTPSNQFPVIPIYGLPPLSGFYPPPPARFSRDLQALAERTLTQIFENIVRTNNVTWFIDSNSKIDIEMFKGLPAEVVEYDGMAGKPPTPIQPNIINAEVMKLVEWMLNMQKELQGVNEARQGSPSQGNVSADLYEASIFQSKALTRCRARLLAHSIYEVSNLLYDMMTTFYQKQRAYASTDGGFAISTWKPVYGLGSRTSKLHIDPTSLLPISQAAMRQIAPMLKETGSIDTETLLTALNVPDAANIAKKSNRELSLQALQKMKRR